MTTTYRIKTTFDNGTYDLTMTGWNTRQEAEAEAQRLATIHNTVLKNTGHVSPVKRLDIVELTK